MQKEIVNKKVELFKSYFPNHTVSENDSIVYREDSYAIRRHSVNAYSVTKNNLHNYGKPVIYREHKGQIFVLKKTGSFIWKKRDDKFKKLTPSALSKIDPDIQKGIAHIFFTGKKYEWLKDFPLLWPIRYFQGFASLTEAKEFLGVKLSDDNFIKLIEELEGKTTQITYGLANRGPNIYGAFSIFFKLREHLDQIISLYLLSGKDKSVFTSLERYLAVCELMGEEPVMPSSREELEELTVEAERRTKNVKNYSNKKVYYTSKLFEIWNKAGIQYKVVDSPKAFYHYTKGRWFGVNISPTGMEKVLHVVVNRPGYNEAGFEFLLNGEQITGPGGILPGKEPIVFSKEPIKTNYKSLE